MKSRKKIIKNINQIKHGDYVLVVNKGKLGYRAIIQLTEDNLINLVDWNGKSHFFNYDINTGEILWSNHMIVEEYFLMFPIFITKLRENGFHYNILNKTIFLLDNFNVGDVYHYYSWIDNETGEKDNSQLVTIVDKPYHINTECSSSVKTLIKVQNKENKTLIVNLNHLEY